MQVISQNHENGDRFFAVSQVSWSGVAEACELTWW